MACFASCITGGGEACHVTEKLVLNLVFHFPIPHCSVDSMSMFSSFPILLPKSLKQWGQRFVLGQNWQLAPLEYERFPSKWIWRQELGGGPSKILQGFIIISNATKELYGAGT